MSEKHPARLATVALLAGLLWGAVPAFAQTGGAGGPGSSSTQQSPPTGASDQAAGEAAVTDNRTGVVAPFSSTPGATGASTAGREGDAALTRGEAGTQIGEIAASESTNRGLSSGMLGLLGLVGLVGLAGLAGLRRRSEATERPAHSESPRRRASNP